MLNTSFKFVDVNKLQVGMILGENIYRDEQLVISEDVILSERHIAMINRMDLSQVKILFHIQSDKVEAKTPFKIDLKSRYRSSVEKFKEICFSVAVGNVVIYDHIKECIDELLDEVSNNPQLAMKLWQIEVADFYTYEHSVKVCMLATLLSKWMNRSEKHLADIGKAGLLHDMGKCNIPNEILNKPDMLTLDEFSVMKTHSTLGYVLLTATKELNQDILKGVLQHHEKADGTGYPGKLKGSDIHEYARIISIVDVFDAMTSNRVYKQKMNPYRVIEILLDKNNESFDKNILHVFIENIRHFYVGCKVVLANGEIAEIVSADTNLYYRPIIKLNNKNIDLSKNHDIEIKEMILE